LQFWEFQCLNVDDAWSLLLWAACDSFEFEKASCVSGYSFRDPFAFYAKSYYAPLWCDLCNTSAHNVSSYPFYASYAHLDLSLPLAQCTGLEGGEPFGYAANFGMNYDLCGLGDALDREHNLVSTPLEGCQDLFVHEGSSSLYYENVLPNPLEHARVSIVSSPHSSSSPKYTYDVPHDISELIESNIEMGHEKYMFNVLGGNVENFESLGYFRGYDATLDPYCVGLVDLPRKIMCNTFVTFSSDFSMAFTLRRLILFFVLICMFSHYQACEPHAVAFDKLLRVLTMSSLRSRVVKVKWSG